MQINLTIDTVMESYPKTSKFRPQSYNKKYKLFENNNRLNWQPRIPWVIKNYLHHVFSVLHYKASHAPRPIQTKWRTAATKFERRHYKIL